jgi:hypothetical protein
VNEHAKPKKGNNGLNKIKQSKDGTACMLVAA